MEQHNVLHSDLSVLQPRHRTWSCWNFLHHGDPDNFVIDQWCAQNIYQALAHTGKIFIYSPGLSEENVARFQGVKVMDCQATVDDLLNTHKNVAVIPDGPYAVGKVVEKTVNP